MHSDTAQRRADLVMSLLRRGPQSVPSLAAATGLARSVMFNAVKKLLLERKIEFGGYQKNPSSYGGQPVKFFRLWTGEPAKHHYLNNRSHEISRSTGLGPEKSRGRTQWNEPRPRRNTGSGVIAGTITHGRGSRWGSGLA